LFTRAQKIYSHYLLIFRSDTTIVRTADDGIRPGETYTVCVQAQTSETVGVVQISEANCIELTTSKRVCEVALDCE